MAIQKPTKAQVTAAITTIVGVLILITTTLPITDMVKLYIGFGIGVIGIIGNIYGVYQTPNGISDKASAAELLTAASTLTSVAVARTFVAPPVAELAVPAPEVIMPSTEVITGPGSIPVAVLPAPIVPLSDVAVPEPIVIPFAGPPAPPVGPLGQ